MPTPSRGSNCPTHPTPRRVDLMTFHLTSAHLLACAVPKSCCPPRSVRFALLRCFFLLRPAPQIPGTSSSRYRYRRTVGRNEPAAGASGLLHSTPPHCPTALCRKRASRTSHPSGRVQLN